MKESERMRQLKENFMQLHNEGDLIPEIAEKFSLDASTVYRALQSIADANNVSREELLLRPKKASEKIRWKAEEKQVKVDMQELQNGFNKAKDAIQETIEFIDNIIKGEEECQQL